MMVASYDGSVCWVVSRGASFSGADLGVWLVFRQCWWAWRLGTLGAAGQARPLRGITSVMWGGVSSTGFGCHFWWAWQEWLGFTVLVRRRQENCCNICGLMELRADGTSCTQLISRAFSVFSILNSIFTRNLYVQSVEGVYNLDTGHRLTTVI